MTSVTKFNRREFVPKNNRKRILPDPQYNPLNAAQINSFTKLAKGVRLAKFLGGLGQAATLNHIQDPSERLQIALNLYPQAVAMASIINDRGAFANHRLIVLEGLYVKGPQETLQSGSLNDLATKGRCVVYQLVDLYGKIDFDKMFELAVYWKDFALYDKLILDYDRFDPTGKLQCQIILTMPEMSQTFETSFDKQIETRYNGNLQSAGELVEILG